MSVSSGGKSKIASFILEAFIFAFWGLFFIYPLLLIVRYAFRYDDGLSFYWFGRLFSNSVLMGQLANSFLLACCSTVLIFLLCLPMSLIQVRWNYLGKSVFSWLLLLPMILPPFVGALSIKRILGQFGILNICLSKLGILDVSQTPPDWLGSGFWVVVLLQIMNLFPIMYLNLSAAMSNLDPSYIQAAQNLGASRWTILIRILLPLLRPGIFAGASIVFIWSFTDIGTPLIVGYEELASVKVFKDLISADVSGRVYSLVVVMLILALTFYIINRFLVGTSRPVEGVKATASVTEKRASNARTLAIWLFLGTVIFVCSLPHIGVILSSFSDLWMKSILPEKYTLRHFNYVLTHPETSQCIVNSLIYAGLSTLIDLVMGFCVAWLSVRRQSAGGKILDFLVMLPLAVPGIILAAGYIAMTAPGTLFEAIGPLQNPLFILVIAYSVRRMPFVVRGVSAGFQQIPETLEQAARNLGASGLTAIRKITIPLLTANLIASGLLTFSFAMLEVSDSLVLAQLRQHYPITKEILAQAAGANLDANSIASCLGVVGMIVLGGSIGTASLMLGKRLGAMFRM